MIRNETDWIERLQFAALPGAVRIHFACETDARDGSVRYTLKSFDAAGHPIGDDRDYDLLKAAMSPLERLAADRTPPFSVELDLKSGTLKEV